MTWPPAVAGIDELFQPVELLGVGGGVAVDEGLLELVPQRLGLQLDDRRLQVLDIAAGRLEEVVHVRIAAHDFQVGRQLREGRRGLVPGIADIIKVDAGQGVFLVIGQPVAHDFDEGQPLQDRRVFDDGLHHPLHQHIVGKFGCFR